MLKHLFMIKFFIMHAKVFFFFILFLIIKIGDFDSQKCTLIESSGVTEVPFLKKPKCDYGLTEQMLKNANESEALEFIRHLMEMSKLKANNGGDELRCVELIKKYRVIFYIKFVLLDLKFFLKILYANTFQQIYLTLVKFGLLCLNTCL
jgi:hypothetical protein